MSSPEPHRPRLVEDPSGVGPDAPYPVPGYPHDDGSPLAVWQRNATGHEAIRHLRSLTAQVQEMADAGHAAYLAECERAIQRFQAQRAVGVAEHYRPGSPGHLRDTARTVPDPEPQPEEPDEDGPAPVGLDEAAAALFAVAPDISRDKLQTILRCNSYQAKRLHANRPEVTR